MSDNRRVDTARVNLLAEIEDLKQQKNEAEDALESISEKLRSLEDAAAEMSSYY